MIFNWKTCPTATRSKYQTQIIFIFTVDGWDQLNLAINSVMQVLIVTWELYQPQQSSLGCGDGEGTVWYSGHIALPLPPPTPTLDWPQFIGHFQTKCDSDQAPRYKYKPEQTNTH